MSISDSRIYRVDTISIFLYVHMVLYMFEGLKGFTRGYHQLSTSSWTPSQAHRGFDQLKALEIEYKQPFMQIGKWNESEWSISFQSIIPIHGDVQHPIHGGIEPGLNQCKTVRMPPATGQECPRLWRTPAVSHKDPALWKPGNVLWMDLVELMCIESGWSWYIVITHAFNRDIYIYNYIYIICNYIHTYVYVCSLNGINPSFPELVRLKKTSINPLTVWHGLAHFASCRLRKRGA